ncbi:MFS transporter [Ramlibacter sp. MAHUQ-53]|uniref:MFS transporter n=1 Tax=unclassified Ramlibacter TaxID=2617605 RepID=UPI00362BC535
MAGERPGRILPAIVFSQLAGASLWFSGNALLPDLQEALGLPADALAGVTSAVQLGFIAGTLVFAVLNLADRFRPRDLFLASALLGALANAGTLLLPALPAPHATLLALRFATGFFLAGIYPVGMKIAATWYREGLGVALGWLVGALVAGTALPHLLRGAGVGGLWPQVVAGVSLLAVAGGVAMHLLVPEGPHGGSGAPFDPRAVVRAFASPQFRASASGYFGHMWELYTLWAFAPMMLAAYAQRQALALDIPFWSFCVIAAGAVGCVGGGLVSRRAGGARVAFGQLGFSGLCCLLSPLAYALPPAGFLAFMLAWGVAVAGDSPQFSALNAALAPPGYVGSALTIVNCIGFAISVASLHAMAWLVERLPAPLWFVPVAAGPALGLLVFRRLVFSLSASPR